MLLTRRSFMASILALATAPAIVRASSLMPLVRPVKLLPEWTIVRSLIPAPYLHYDITQHHDVIDVTTILDNTKRYETGLYWYTGSCDLLVPEGRILGLLADGVAFQPDKQIRVTSNGLYKVMKLRDIDLAPYGNRLPQFSFLTEEQ